MVVFKASFLFYFSLICNYWVCNRESGFNLNFPHRIFNILLNVVFTFCIIQSKGNVNVKSQNH